jgi:hypothetical protein
MNRDMTEYATREEVGIVAEGAKEGDLILARALEEAAERIKALEFEGSAVTFLAKIAEHMNMLTLATMQNAGLVWVDFDENGNFVTRLTTPEEREAMTTVATRYVPGKTSTLPGDGGPLAWVLSPPAPYNDVEIVCSPDGESPIGMRCRVEKKVIGGERKIFRIEVQEIP